MKAKPSATERESVCIWIGGRNVRLEGEKTSSSCNVLGNCALQMLYPVNKALRTMQATSTHTLSLLKHLKWKGKGFRQTTRNRCYNSIVVSALYHSLISRPHGLMSGLACRYIWCVHNIKRAGEVDRLQPSGGHNIFSALHMEWDGVPSRTGWWWWSPGLPDIRDRGAGGNRHRWWVRCIITMRSFCRCFIPGVINNNWLVNAKQMFQQFPHHSHRRQCPDLWLGTTPWCQCSCQSATRFRMDCADHCLICWSADFSSEKAYAGTGKERPWNLVV